MCSTHIGEYSQLISVSLNVPEPLLHPRASIIRGDIPLAVQTTCAENEGNKCEDQEKQSYQLSGRRLAKRTPDPPIVVELVPERDGTCFEGGGPLVGGLSP